MEVVPNGLPAGPRVRNGGFDIILLDGMLPGKDDFDVCRDLRRAGLKRLSFFSPPQLETGAAVSRPN